MKQRCPSGVALDVVERAEDPRWATMLRRADAVITGGHLLTGSDVERAPQLRAVQMRGVGWQDRVPVKALRERGIKLATCQVGTGQAVAEHALMLILALQRQLLRADAEVRRGCFHHGDSALRQASHRLAGSTVGLIGMGGIGQSLARLLAPMGIRGLYCSRSPVATTTAAALGFQRVPLARLLGESDVVSLHVPGGAETRHLIGAAEIAMMKPGAIVVNTARGSLIDHSALFAALASGHLGGAGLDVFDPEPPSPNDPLLALPNVILTPHCASAQYETFVEKIDFCLGNLAHFLGGKALESEVRL